MSNAKYIWNYFYNKIGNEYGVAGLMGNLEAESNLQPNNVQNGFGWEDEEYTRQVDNGTYTESQFVNDSIGYGLAQWTYSTRKQALYNKYKSGGYSSIGSIELACDYLFYELEVSYGGVLNTLKTATNVRQASDAVLHDFEKPKDQSESVEIKRANMSQAYYDEYASENVSYNAQIESAIEWAVSIAEDDSHGYDQDNRWGVDYDCSSLLIQAYEQAGVPVKSTGASYTGDMESAFAQCGFIILPYYNGMSLVRGDVLWKTGHTEMYIGDNKKVGAHINEFGETTGGQSGDQTGNEISVTNYSETEYWEKVFRLPTKTNDNDEPIVSKSKKKKFNFILFNKNRKGV